MRYNYFRGGYRKKHTFLRGILISLGVIAVLSLASFYILQNYVIYTADGIMLDFTGGYTAVTPTTQASSGTKITPTVKPTKAPTPTGTGTPASRDWNSIKAVTIPGEKLGDIASYLAVASASGLDTLIIDVKGEDGTLVLPVENALAPAVVSASAVSEAIAKAKAGGVRVLARISCFRDTRLVRENRDYAIVKKTGGLWTDRFGYYWADPYKTAVSDYIAAITTACKTAGFDGIIFDNTGFPYAGTTSEIDYGTGDAESGRTDAITAFIGKLRDAAGSGYPLWLAVDYPAAQDGRNPATGLDIAAAGEKDFGIIPVFTATGTGSLVYPKGEENAYGNVSFDEMLMKLSAILPSGESYVVPMIRLFMAQSTEKAASRLAPALAELAGKRPGFFIISTKDGAYTADMMK